MKRTQAALQFLQSLRSTHDRDLLGQAAVGSEFDNSSLAAYAVSLGYDVDSEDIAEAFRVQMLAREGLRRSRVLPAHSPTRSG